MKNHAPPQSRKSFPESVKRIDQTVATAANEYVLDAKWNKLELTNLSDSKDGDIQSVSFEIDGQMFSLTERSWSGMEGELYADFSFLEDGAEVSAIGCSAGYGEYGTNYRCHTISAFRKRGNWATILLDLSGRKQIEREKLTIGFKYFHADEIKSHFEE